VTVRHPIAAGETLSRILSRYDVASREATEWCRAASQKANLRRLVPGRHVALSFAGGELTTLQFPTDDEHNLVVTRISGSELNARIEALPAQTRIVGARGIVEGTFYRAAQQASVPEAVISSMVDLLAWKIDFSTDVRPGDHFRVLYEHRVAPDGRPLRPGRIVAAEYEGARRSAQAFLYEDEAGESVYLDAQARRVERAFLRYPLEFTRITSTFSHSRFHPILKRRRPHRGVDFAAPQGTPVRSIGKGTVRLAGWKGGLGRTVEVDHGDGVVSVYGHLRRIRSGIRPGAKVGRGEVVGAVGMTGLATGPHLHFALFERGRYVNPLKTRGWTPRVVKVDMRKFEVVRSELASQLRSIPGSYRLASSTPPVALSAVAQARQLGSIVLTL